MPDRESIPRTPRWVKVFGLIILAVVVLFAILLIRGPGGHGPSRHIPSGMPPRDAGDTSH